MNIKTLGVFALVAAHASFANAANIPNTSTRSFSALPRTAISTACGVGSCDARFTPESARATEQVLKQGLSKIVKLQKQMLKLSKGKKHQQN